VETSAGCAVSPARLPYPPLANLLDYGNQLHVRSDGARQATACDSTIYERVPPDDVDPPSAGGGNALTRMQKTRPVPLSPSEMFEVTEITKAREHKHDNQTG